MLSLTINDEPRPGADKPSGGEGWNGGEMYDSLQSQVVGSSDWLGGFLSVDLSREQPLNPPP